MRKNRAWGIFEIVFRDFLLTMRIFGFMAYEHPRARRGAPVVGAMGGQPKRFLLEISTAPVLVTTARQINRSVYNNTNRQAEGNQPAWMSSASCSASQIVANRTRAKTRKPNTLDILALTIGLRVTSAMPETLGTTGFEPATYCSQSTSRT